MQLFNPFRTSRCLFHLSGFFFFFFFIWIYYVHFSQTRHPRFSVPGNCDFCDFLVYFVILYINIYIYIYIYIYYIYIYI